MEQLFAGLAKGKGGGDPFGGQMANAQHLWSFLDEMASSDPEEYKKFMQELGIRYIFNLTYAPDYNPIELVFSKIKQKFKTLRA